MLNIFIITMMMIIIIIIIIVISQMRQYHRWHGVDFWQRHYTDQQRSRSDTGTKCGQFQDE